MMRRLQPSLAVAVSLVANILLLALLSTPTGATHYAVHMSVPQSGPSENAVQLAQWIFSARAAADDVNTNWASSTGNTLEILLLDNAGNSNLNVEHALDSIQNTSNVVALLLAEDEDNSNFADEIARLGRYFKIPVVSATSRTTSMEASPADSTYISMATAQSFDATVFSAIMANNSWSNFSILYDGVTTTLNGVLNGLYEIGNEPGSPLLLQSNITLNGNPTAAIQSAVRDSVNVMMIVGTDATALEGYMTALEALDLASGRYSLFDGYPLDEIYALPNGSHVLDIVDANATTRASFISAMQSKGAFPLGSALSPLFDHTIHVYDAVRAIARAIEVAEQSSVPATRQNVWAALANSDYEGLSGNMGTDAMGFRQSGYARILNLQGGEVVVPWTYEQQVVTNLAPTLFMGNTWTIPSDAVTLIALGQLTSTLGIGFDVTPVLQFAIDIVNENTSDWMPVDNRLILVNYNDSGVTSVEVTSSIQLQLFGVAGVIGPLTSSLALAAQGVLGPYGIPQLSPSATSSQLSDKSLYPSFLRNLQPDSLQGAAIVNLCVHFGWTRVAIISSTDDYGSGLAQTISTTAVQSGVTILANIAIDITQSEMDSGMQAIKDSGALILIVVTETTSLPAILSSMQNTDYKPNAVVASDFLLSEGMAYLVETTGWPAESWNGWISTNPPSGLGDFYNWVYESAVKRSDRYPGLMNMFETAFTQVPLNIDAVFIYADAIRRVVEAGGNPRDGPTLFDALLKTNRTLCTGPTMFNQNGDRLGPFDIMNVQNGEIVLVGKFDANQGEYQSLNSIVWPNGNSSLPADRVPRVNHWLEWSSGGGAAMAAIASFGLVLVALTFGVVVWQRKSAIIMSATWEFLILMLVGSGLGYGSIFTWIGEPKPYICALRIWLPPMAFSLIMAPLLAKTWRLHRIFTLGSLKVSPIRLWKLGVFSGVLIALQIIICAFWIGLGTIEPIVVNDPASNSIAYVLCEQKASNRIATYVTFGFTGFCLVVGAYYAFRVRNLPKEFNESRWIGFVIYNSILSAIIVIVLGYSLSNSPITVLILICICTFVISTGCVGLMMLPKVWVLIIHPEKRSSSTAASGSHKMKTTKNTFSSVASVTVGSMSGTDNRRHDFTRYDKGHEASQPTSKTTGMKRTGRPNSKPSVNDSDSSSD